MALTWRIPSRRLGGIAMMRALNIILTNEDKGYQFSEWTEQLDSTHMGEDATMGEIYRAVQEEYGRCKSKVYVDVDGGPPKQVGWFFVSRQEYEDSRDHETYLRGAWVTVGEYRPARSEGVTF